MMWLAAVAIFAGLFWLVTLALPGNRVSKKRLGIEREKRPLRLSLGDERQRRLAQALNLADIDTEPGQFVLRVLLGSVLLAILGLLIDPILGLVLLVLPYLVIRFWVGHKGRKRQAQFAGQLPDLLQAIIMSLRSGFGLSQALTTALSEADEPIKAEFDRALAEARMGRDLSDALRSLAQRMDSTDLDWVVGAVEINRDTGGNLSEILATVNNTIRERGRIQRKIKTFTAEGKLSARILTIAPFLIVLWQWRAHPEGTGEMFHGAGLLVLCACLAVMAMGWLWIRRIVTIKI